MSIYYDNKLLYNMNKMNFWQAYKTEIMYTYSVDLLNIFNTFLCQN